MKLTVSKLGWTVSFFFPLVLFGGMLQLNNLWAASRMATTALPTPTNFQLLILSAVIYPLFLVAFFRADSHKPLFQVSTVIFISAVLGLVNFLALSLLFSLFITEFDNSVGWFNAVVLVIDVVAAFGFLLALRETDLHKLKPRTIWNSLFCLEACVVAFVIYNSGMLHPVYTYVTAKVPALKYFESADAAPSPMPSAPAKPKQK